MPPNTGSQPTPLPSTSSAPSTPLSQPPISSFFQRAGETARNSVSNAMSINRSILDSDSDSETEMDLSVNRKRDRDANEDEATESPLAGRRHSISMLTNTSLLESEANPSRRTRLSGISSPDSASTPSRLEDEMNIIRSHATHQNIPLDSNPEGASGGTDFSSASNEARLEASLGGIRQLTRQAVGFQDNAPGHLTWDNNDLNISINNDMLSPRPTPNLLGEEEAAPADKPDNDPLPESVKNSILASLQGCIKDQLDKAFDRINDSLILSIEAAGKSSEKNKSDIQDMDIRIDGLESLVVSQEDIVNSLCGDVRDIENENMRHRNLTGVIQDQVDTQAGHIDRIDATLTTVARQSVIQSLLQRISALEAQAGPQAGRGEAPESGGEPPLSTEEIKQFRRQQKQESDNYYIRTVKFKGYAPPASISNPRRQAREYLGMIDSEDIIAGAKNVSFSPDKASFRVTFHDMEGLFLALSHLRNGCHNIRRNNQIPTLSFSQLSPPRLQATRVRLQNRGNELKRQREINSFTFVMSNGQLAMRVTSRGSRPRNINDSHQPEDNAQNMDVDEAGYRCPVCLGPFDNENPISLYQCGHNLHTSCLRTLLGQGTQCPICRQTPGITPEQINCTVCQMVMASDDSSEDQTVIVARKCGHFHLRGCQRDYLSGLTQEFPFSNQALEVLNSSNLPGCLTCVGADPIPPNFLDTIMSPVAYTPGMADYVDMSHLPPPPPIQEAAPPAQVAAPAPVSGSNSVPIGGARARHVRWNVPPRRRTNRPQSPPPSPPRGEQRGHRNRRNRSRS